MFTAKHNPELLQSRSGQRPHPGTGLVNFFEKGLPRYLAGKTRRLRSPGVLQTCDNPTEKVWEPKAASGAFFEGEIEFSGAFRHTAQTYLKGRFVQRPIYIDKTCCSYAPTATPQAADSHFSGILLGFCSTLVA
jgi:hypothetical protein